MQIDGTLNKLTTVFNPFIFPFNKIVLLAMEFMNVLSRISEFLIILSPLISAARVY